MYINEFLFRGKYIFLKKNDVVLLYKKKFIKVFIVCVYIINYDECLNKGLVGINFYIIVVCIRYFIGMFGFVKFCYFKLNFSFV